MNGQTIAEAKRHLRQKAREKRLHASAQGAEIAAIKLRDLFLSRFRPGSEDIVAGYWPIGEEIDVRPLLFALAERGVRLALPSVVERGGALAFRLFEPGDRLDPGPHGTFEPVGHTETLLPTIVLVPMLAFDRQGHRLGYGGGYYDRSLAALRANGKILAAGVAFAAQEMDNLPHDGQDQRLDRIVTEKEIIELPESQ